jgi:hypothetical protein
VKYLFSFSWSNISTGLGVSKGTEIANKNKKEADVVNICACGKLDPQFKYSIY